MHALAANHALADGNKRTAWPATATFLARNGVDLTDVDQDVAYDLVIDVASATSVTSRGSRGGCGSCDVGPTHGRPGLVRALTGLGRR
ncbi:hypothetical protein [Streptomyces sp. NPDC001450]